MVVEIDTNGGFKPREAALAIMMVYCGSKMVCYVPIFLR